MNRAIWTIVILLLSSLIGCRSAQRTSLAPHPSGNVSHKTLVTPEEQQWNVATAAAFVQVSEHIEETVPEVQPEPLPSQVMSDGSLTLADLESIAFEYNPTLAIAAARMDAAYGRQVQAGRYPNPVVGYHATEIGVRDTAGQQGAFVSQRIITGGKLRLDEALAGKEIDEAHFRLHAQEQRVLSDVRVRFFDALVAQRQVALTEELAAVGDDVVQATQSLFRSGLTSENHLLLAQISADKAHITADNARNEQLTAWRRLAAVIGLPTMQMNEIVGEFDLHLPMLDWDTAYSAVLACNPDLNAARVRAERSHLVFLRAKREPIPNVDLSVSHRHHNFTQDEVTNVQVGIPIPIFDKNQGNIRSAEADWMAATKDVERIELEIQERLATVYQQYANAHLQVDRYRERMLPNGRRSLELVNDGYKQGQVEYLTLLTTKQTVLQLDLSYLDSLRELRATRAIIESQLLTHSLGENP